MTNPLTDDELREKTKKNTNFNGGYAIEICRGCNSFWTAPEGRTDTAKIRDKCRNCFDKVT